MTWLEIKTLLGAMKPYALKGLVGTTAGATPEIALYARATNMEIAGNPYKFWWLTREYTLTLTGATTYNLRTLIPDLGRIYQVTGSAAPNREAPYQSLRDYNIDLSGGVRISVLGDATLKVTGATSGTLTIPYFSRYLVESSGGTRKMDFTDDTDVSVIPEQHIMALVEGIKRFINDKTDEATKLDARLVDGKPMQIDRFSYLVRNMILDDRPIHEVVYDFRFNPAP